MDNKLNITVENGVKTLFIGQALTPKEAQQFEASGDINAVKTFLEKEMFQMHSKATIKIILL